MKEFKSDDPYKEYQTERQKVIENLLRVIELKQYKYNLTKTEI